MPLKNGNFTHQERAFIEAYGSPPSVLTAAEAAGLHPRSGYQLMARPAVAAEIRRQQLDRLATEGLPAATQTFLDCMRDTKAGWPSRIRAAEAVYDRTKPEDTGAGKELHELTASELTERIALLEARKVSLAKPIEATVLEPDQAGVFE